jgi:hypothetical protein
MHTDNTAPCDDGNGCTTNDTCQNGACVGTPVQCGGDQCNPIGCVSETSTAFLCVPGAPLNCDDGNPCTTDTCDPTLGCQHTFNTAACDDGNPCTTGDVCSNGVCAGTPVVCTGGDICSGLNTCDPATGQCATGPPLNCDDNDACTTDTCDPTTGCLHNPVPDYWTCRLTQVYAALGTIAAEVTAGPTSALGSATRQQKLLALTQAARTRVQAAAGLAGHVAARKISQASKRLGTFTRVLKKGMAAGRVDANLGGALVQQASSNAQMLQTLFSYVPAGK